MNKEILYIAKTLETTLNGEPWYGRPIVTMLQEVDASMVYKKPGENAHSLADLLYHMITWAEFTLKRLQGDQQFDNAWFDKLDWRNIDPVVHNWADGVRLFKQLNEQIIANLQTRDDELLKEKVDFREYNFRFLLNGYIQHNIYHIGQIAYLKKLLEGS